MTSRPEHSASTVPPAEVITRRTGVWDVTGGEVGSDVGAVELAPVGSREASAWATSAWLRVRVDSPKMPEPISVTAARVTPVARNAAASQPATATAPRRSRGELLFIGPVSTTGR